MFVAKRSLLVGFGSLILVACIFVAYARIQAQPLTFNQAKAISTADLARKLLGDRLGSKVIEAVRHERNGVASYVEFYTQPELTDPRLSGVCRSDVITVEYNWMDSPAASAPVRIAHVQAVPRYKSFPVPPGEPGTADYDRAEASACAKMRTAIDSFRAPSAGDAQWLAAIESQYSNESEGFSFTCTDFADSSCVQSRRALRRLKLGPKTEVKAVDCPEGKTGDQIDLCYRLSFPYPGKDEYSDNHDERDGEDYSTEWIVNVFAGMRNGMAPVRIRSLSMEHVRPPIVMS